LSDLLRTLREKQMERELRPQAERFGLRVWGFMARRPALYSAGTWVAARVLRWMGGDKKLIHSLPVGKGWTDTRDMPAPAGKTFRELYREKKARA
jgi:L-lactate dehydrogenase complex protein LldF